MTEDDRGSITGSLVKIASICLTEVGCTTMWVVRHYNGSGADAKMIEVYVIRNQKFLGRFAVQEITTFDAAWDPASEHTLPATQKDVETFRKARMQMLSLVDKFWP
ncbi:MAG TPA: hypothetical protein VM577_00725 [Anaerovoracaceae bacterium]|nr:hypothetical protein [Anaerovoracaceae bacterium]